MTQAESVRLVATPQATHFTSRATSILLSAMSLVLFATVLTMSSDRQSVALVLLVGVAAVLGAIIVLHSHFLLELRSQQKSVVSKLQSTAHDMRLAQLQLRANRAFARSASAEAEALRTTTLTLTSNWQLDHVLDTLLASLAELVPYQSAKVLLLEDDSRLFLARENVPDRDRDKEAQPEAELPWTLDLADFPLFARILDQRSPILLADVSKEREWTKVFPSLVDTRSWLCVPLVAADRNLGLLCADHRQAGALTSEHLRLARSLAVSISAAIQNARLFEQAQIYGSELEKRLSELRNSRQELERKESERLVSEDRFQKLFHSSPIALSITTMKDERFVDVNQAFEQRYGFMRSELIGRTVHGLGLWENSEERRKMLGQLQRGVAVRNLVTRQRAKSGELKLTAYSADRIESDGKLCILGVSGDLPQPTPTLVN
jgi:PAS domain S-box-containing protein